MSRTVSEWIGKSDDSIPPPSVRLRVLKRHDRKCAMCGQRIVGTYVCDHRKAIINGGANREFNLQPICVRCDRTVKTPADVKERAKTDAMTKAVHGIKRTSRPMPGSRNTPFKRRMDGTTTWRT